jgi:hypothetical protein
VRLSRPRLLLRAALLLTAAGFMTWRGFDTRARAAAAGVDAATAEVLGRIALIEWLLGGLALLTAAFALAALRQGPHARPLHLGGAAGGPSGPKDPPPGSREP